MDRTDGTSRYIDAYIERVKLEMMPENEGYEVQTAASIKVVVCVSV